MSKLRTIAYVDGYNLYYSALTKTRYKWLDLFRLIEHILTDAYAGTASQLLGVKFFTAPIMGKYSKDSESPNRQQRYHNALTFGSSGPIEIVNGFHTEETKKALSLDDNRIHRVRVPEEKQTDVNIGLHMYRDAVQSKVYHSVVVSNDSDLAPALELIEHDFPYVVRGVILPTLETNRKARQSGQLSNLSTWTRRYLKTSDLEKCQLPRSMRNRKGKAILRPAEW